VLNGLETAFIFDPVKKQEVLNDALNKYKEIESQPNFQQVLDLEKNFIHSRVLKQECAPYPVKIEPATQPKTCFLNFSEPKPKAKQSNTGFADLVKLANSNFYINPFQETLKANKSK
jgi:hypothetical protein